MFKEISQTIYNLLHSDKTLYSISKESGIAMSTIQDLAEKEDYSMVRYGTIKKLYLYAKENNLIKYNKDM